MTLITLVAKENFASLLTDGRLYDSEKEMAVDENYCKYTKLDKNVVIAGAGGHDHIKQIIKISQQLYKKNHNLYRLSQSIKNQLINDVPREKYPQIKVNLVLAGLNSNQEITTCTIDNVKDNPLSFYKPKSKDIVTVITTDEGDNDKAFEELESLFYKYKSNSPDTFLLAQKEYNELIATKNITVNSKHYHCLIEKKSE